MPDAATGAGCCGCLIRESTPGTHALPTILRENHRTLPHLESPSLIRDGLVLPDSENGTRGDQAMRPIQRLGLLCDEGSLHVLRSGVVSVRMGDRARVGDGVVGAAGRIGGRPVFCYAQDGSFAGGSLGEAHADTILRVLRLAGQAGVPIIGFVESGGARLQEGIAALDGYARLFAEIVALSGQVPQISVVTGTAAGGASYAPALTDFVVMTDAASMFLTGPRVVQEVTGDITTARQLGGPAVHERNGVCQFVAPTEVDAIFLVRDLLSYFPQNATQAPPVRTPVDPGGPPPAGLVPVDPRRPYDVLKVLVGIFDAQSVLEVSRRWAPNIVTAFARLEGRPVGVLANQPSHLGGVIDADASQKAARFVRVCNAFGLPLVVLVDTPGFLPGTHQEACGVIRHGAKLVHAFAEATVPRLTVVLRKSFGGAYIAMNSKDLGAHLYLAWSDAELGIMGPHAAVEIMHRRKLAAADDRVSVREELARDYRANHLTAASAARHGYVDEVIAPNATRARLAWALSALATAGEPRGRVRNIPL
jgi:acetyl-CoA carboxylase carboxyltransferase component